MSNGDYIRQMMGDDYIAQEFCGIVAPFNGDCDDCPLCHNPKCALYEERIKWLKEEYVGEKETEMEVKYSELEEIRDILSDLVKRIEKMEENCHEE